MHSPVFSIVDVIEHQDWYINQWKINFLLTERLLSEFKKLSHESHWYEDPILVDTCLDRLRLCINSIRQYHQTFGALPQVGDRLFDQDTGLLVQGRSIDGNLMTITFILTV